MLIGIFYEIDKQSIMLIPDKGMVQEHRHYLSTNYRINPPAKEMHGASTSQNLTLASSVEYYPSCNFCTHFSLFEEEWGLMQVVHASTNAVLGWVCTFAGGEDESAGVVAYNENGEFLDYYETMTQALKVLLGTELEAIK
jgi:hypothetical protein